MTAAVDQKDLVVLTPGKDDSSAIGAMLDRYAALGIRPITFELQQHPGRDAGCRGNASEFLRRERNRFRHALVVFDLEGCGAEAMSREQLETEVDRALAASGWSDRAAAVVIDPELEVWVWANSPHVAQVLGWQDREPSLSAWLKTEGLQSEGAAKPHKPKEAVQRALQIAGKKRSSAIYAELANLVSLQRCEDPAFVKLKTTLQRWFPENS